MAHAYYVTGSAEEGIARTEAFAKAQFELSVGNPDLTTLRYHLFSVDDARKLMDIIVASPLGEHKVVTVATTRFFHEAQNALLKIFEEPPPNVTLILVVPSAGMLLPTLRSRLTPLPPSGAPEHAISDLTRSFLTGDSEEREKIITRLVDRSKSDKDAEKQEARSEAVRLAEDLVRIAQKVRKEGREEQELRLLIEDLGRFLPLLHTRSAPLKLIFEHLLLVIPKSLSRAHV